MHSKFLLTILFIITVNNGFSSSNQEKIDSLSKLLPEKTKLDKIRLLNEIAYLYLSVSPQQTKILSHQAISLLEKNNNDKIEAKSQHNLGSAHWYLGNLDSAMICYLKSIKLNEGYKDPVQFIRTTSNIGVLYFEIGEKDSAWVYYNKALKIANKYNDSLGIAIAYSNMANIYDKEGKVGLALNHHEKAIKLYLALNETDKIIHNYSNLGIIHRNLGNYKNSVNYYQKALKLIDESDNYRQKGIVLFNLANVYYDWERNNDALVLFQESFELFNKAEYKIGVAYALNAIAKSYELNENLDSALYYYELGEQKFKDMQNVEGQANSFLDIGQLYISLKEYNKALAKTNYAIEIYTNTNNTKGYIDATRNKAMIFQHLGKHNLAVELAKKSLKLAVENKMPDTRLLCLETLFKIYKMAGKDKEALEYYIQRKILNDSVFTSEKSWQINELRTQYETDKKEKEITLLNNQKEIQDLELEKQQAEIKQEKNLRYFILIIVLGIAVMSWLIFNRYKLRQKSFQNSLKMKNLQVESKFLRQQMNPHFIFNSLNSIQSFISENDSFSAEVYLSKFAHLMRLILENIRKNTIPLEKEIEALTLYLELEQLRFNSKFEFEISVDSNIELEFIEIPAMISQPYIENSILHGMTGKVKDGKVSISFTKNNGVLKCIVEDNGIGREKAMEFKKQSNRKKESLGMQLSRDRIDIFKKQWNIDAFEKIIDLKNEKGEALGTKVELQIPYKEIE